MHGTIFRWNRGKAASISKYENDPSQKYKKNMKCASTNPNLVLRNIYAPL
jgi:hypothetical protein